MRRVVHVGAERIGRNMERQNRKKINPGAFDVIEEAGGGLKMVLDPVQPPCGSERREGEKTSGKKPS